MNYHLRGSAHGLFYWYGRTGDWELDKEKRAIMTRDEAELVKYRYMNTTIWHNLVIFPEREN